MPFVSKQVSRHDTISNFSHSNTFLRINIHLGPLHLGLVLGSPQADDVNYEYFNEQSDVEAYDIHFIDSFLKKSLQERFSKHKFILVGFQSLFPTDPSQFIDQVLENCNFLVLFYQNDD